MTAYGTAQSRVQDNKRVLACRGPRLRSGWKRCREYQRAPESRCLAGRDTGAHDCNCMKGRPRGLLLLLLVKLRLLSTRREIVPPKNSARRVNSRKAPRGDARRRKKESTRLRYRISHVANVQHFGGLKFLRRPR